MIGVSLKLIVNMVDRRFMKFSSLWLLFFAAESIQLLVPFPVEFIFWWRFFVILAKIWNLGHDQTQMIFISALSREFWQLALSGLFDRVEKH